MKREERSAVRGEGVDRVREVIEGWVERSRGWAGGDFSTEKFYNDSKLNFNVYVYWVFNYKFR